MDDRKATVPPVREPSALEVRTQLARVLSSEVFARSDRLSSLLKFIVERTLDGQRHALKEQVIAIELYGKGSDFSSAADPIVRVDARRLRDKLREYYASAPTDPIVISVPKGSYAPLFEARPISEPAIDAPALRRSTWRWPAVAAAVLVLGLGWLALREITVTADPPRLLTVTSLPGAEQDPSLSPDGNFVAFGWENPDASRNSDIWIKAVEGDELRRLTDTPDEHETSPAWSPDGRLIAFTRAATGPPSVWVIPALGGMEQRVHLGASAAWTPDSQSLVLGVRNPSGRHGLIHYSLRTGTSRQLTESPFGLQDVHPRVSPDGKMLAFARNGSGQAALFVMSLAGGEPTQRTEWAAGFIGGVSWTPDGREIFLAQPEISGRQIVRVTASGTESPVAVAGAPYGSVGPSVSRSRGGQQYRLAFVSGEPDVALRMIDLAPSDHAGIFRAVQPFCESTRIEIPGRFSLDGEHVAFVSDRTGSKQVWIARRDGSNLRRLTDLANATVNVGSWSPDGRLIALDAMIGGNTDIYVVSVEGGPARRLTDSAASDIDPEWSRDGRWIFYASALSGRSEIWKMRPDGSDRVQLTSEGGFEPRAAPDGRSLYFVDAQRAIGLGIQANLKRLSIEGGRAELVYSGLFTGAWDVTDSGITFIMGRPIGFVDSSRDADVLAEYGFADRQVRRLGELPFRIGRGWVSRFLIVSPDGRWAVASHVERVERDVMVLDGFR
jgi:Tol biopolymer transport system component